MAAVDRNNSAQQAGGDPTRSLEAATAVFAEHKGLLFSLVYNLLGTVTDTEDVLQDAWLAWASSSRQEVVNARAYLVRIAVNQALLRLRHQRHRRETYVGPWLPEPLATGADAAADSAEQAEAVSLAMLVVLETLTPLERTVFVLREVFGYDHTEVAAILGRRPAAVRQLAHRAREHVQARRPRSHPDPRVRRAATERFLAAAVGGDLHALLEVLAPDVTLWTDGGGKLRAALRVIQGRDKVARLLVAVTTEAVLADLTFGYAEVNGGPGVLLFAGGELLGVVVVDPSEDGERVRAIYGVVNPDKLTRLAGAVRDRR
jgi:RNA polymerase sigma factor (sigma-70 family)